MLKNLFAPNPLFSVCMMVMTILALLAAFKITPSVPPNLGYFTLGVMEYCPEQNTNRNDPKGSSGALWILG